MSMPMSNVSRFDHDRASQFAEKTAALLDAGAVTVMMSIGHRLRLFDLMAGRPAATSAEIADHAGLAERYVREWLAVMVVGGVVTYHPATGTYLLPDEHAASLTRGGSLGNLAVYSQCVALMGAVQNRILDCFATGEGTRYEDYPCFHDFMEEDSGQTVTAQLFDVVLPLADGIGDRLRAGIDAADFGCGRGSALIALAKRFPSSRFIGYDLCEDAIEHASRTAERAGLSNLRFAVRDLGAYDEASRFDLITSFDAVHDQKHPGDLLKRVRRALRPGGTYLMQDIGGSARLENNLDFPMAALLYSISCTHCTPVSIGQGGDGLGTMWGWETAEHLLREAGFRDVTRHVLPHDPMNVWFVSR
jgi:SAM-dependent methyltransferase